MKIFPVLVLPLLAVALPLCAAERRVERNGDSTRAWLELQKSGAAAPEDARPMAGEVADQVYQRYLNSYKHPIPDTYSRDRFVSGGGSGS